VTSAEFPCHKTITHLNCAVHLWGQEVLLNTLRVGFLWALYYQNIHIARHLFPFLSGHTTQMLRSKASVVGGDATSNHNGVRWTIQSQQSIVNVWGFPSVILEGRWRITNSHVALRLVNGLQYWWFHYDLYFIIQNFPYKILTLLISFSVHITYIWLHYYFKLHILCPLSSYNPRSGHKLR